MDKKLTKKQQQVYDCIKDYLAEFGYGPSVRDLCTRLNFASPSTAHSHLKTLEEKGYITRDQSKSRSIRLVQDTPAKQVESSIFGTVEKDSVNLPLIGNVAAGEPLHAEEHIEDYVELPIDLVGADASFLLRVRGDSMIEVGIYDGDYVAVRQQNYANNGDIVVAIVEDGATVKTFYDEGSYVRLQPENSALEPIIVHEQLYLAGKVVALFRQL